MDHFFNVALNKYDKRTADGKLHIAKDVLAHVANIESHIEKAHWIKKIAHEVDVEEKVINDVLKTITSAVDRYQPVSPIITTQADSFQKRSEVIRNSLVGLILSDEKIWKETFEKDGDATWSNEDSLISFVLKNGPQSEFSFDKLLVNIDDEREIESLRMIYFNAKYLFTQEGVVEYSIEELRELVANYISQYTKELQKERLHAIIKQIENAEQKGDKQALANLMSEFTKLSQEMQ
jgi:uncharacterized protein YbjQ (UPF0145 family)